MTGAVKCTTVLPLHVLHTTNIVTTPHARFPNVTICQRVPINVNPVLKDRGVQKHSVDFRGNKLGVTIIRDVTTSGDDVGIAWNYTVPLPPVAKG